VARDDIPVAAQLQRVADEYNARAAKEHRVVNSTSEEDDYLKGRLEIDIYNINVETMSHCELWMFRVPVSVAEGLRKFKFISDSHLSGP
jgi:hypothetical protein